MVHLGNAALGLGHVDQALRYIGSAYPTIQRLGDQYQISWALQNFGEVERVRGNYRQAREYYEQAQAAARESEAPTEDARLAHNFGYLALHDGDADEAEALFRQGLAMFRVMVMKRGSVSVWPDRLLWVWRTVGRRGPRRCWPRPKHNFTAMAPIGGRAIGWKLRVRANNCNSR